MSRRERWLFTAMQLVTVVVVASLLIYSVFTSQKLAESRQRQAVAAAEQNQKLLSSLDKIVRDIRAAQVNQRRAFEKLARRNEVLHDRDPGEAPDFESLPSLAEPAAEQPEQESPGQGQGNRPDRPPGRPDRDRPEPPPPEPLACVPVINVCVDQRARE